MRYLEDQAPSPTIKLDLFHLYLGTHSLKVISYNILSNSVHETRFHGVRFSTVASYWHSNKFQILEQVGFGTRGVQPVRMCMGVTQLIGELNEAERLDQAQCYISIKAFTTFKHETALRALAAFTSDRKDKTNKVGQEGAEHREEAGNHLPTRECSQPLVC